MLRHNAQQVDGANPLSGVFQEEVLQSLRHRWVKMPSTVPPGAHRGPDNGPNFAGETPCIPDRDRPWARAPGPSVRNYRYRVPASRSGGRWWSAHAWAYRRARYPPCAAPMDWALTRESCARDALRTVLRAPAC